MPSKNSDQNSNEAVSQIELDLYFLIARFLSQGRCQEAGRTLIKELEKHELLHKSLDWTGSQQETAYQNSLSRFRDIAPDHLLQICEKIGPLLNNALPPPMPAGPSLCGLGRHSLLRTQNSIHSTTWSSRTFCASIARRPVSSPHNFITGHNWAHSIFGRECGGSRFKNLLRPIRTLYGQMKLHRRILGHLSSVYCILFDRTGTRIFTGSDDCLIKCWSSSQGRLLATFRGHQSEICDMDISYENTLLASASCDKEIRIWDTRSGKPITILQSHSAMITSIEFSALVQGDTRYLISTGRDGNVCFWLWNARTFYFETRPYKFTERNRPGVAMLCSSCSSGGRFVAVGGSDNLVHIYHIPFEHNTTTIGPLTIAEQDEHTNTVDSIWFSRDGVRLISGSKDGTARIWTFECSTWTSSVLDVSRTTECVVEPSASVVQYNHTRSKPQSKDNTNKLCVIMVAWDYRDENVMTSLTDFTIKVWNSRSRHLVSTLKGHTDEAYCLEPHPDDKRVLLTAGHDGNVFLWDVLRGSVLMSFHNMLEGLGHGAVFDAKFSRDGNSFACTDSHGHLLIFGYADGKAYTKSPVQQFFHTDYRPLIRDQQGYVLDEQTQQAPHLMPPPFLVDVDGNPYPPDLQRLVPGRENSNDSQLLPNLVVEENDAFQVIDVENIPEEPPQEQFPPPRSALDNRIQELLQEVNDEDDGDVDDEADPGDPDEPPPFASPSSAVGLRREGDTVGIRQMHRNAPRSQVASDAEIMALRRRVITPQYSPEERMQKEYIRKKKGHFELSWYRRERKKRRPVSHRRLSKDGTKQSPESQQSHRSRRKLGTITRFKEDPEEEEEERDTSRKKRWIRSIRRNAHGYSTRSSAPRRRMSSVAESGHEDCLNDDELDEEDEHFSSGETSVDSSSEEDFSQRARILRRSKRSKVTNGDVRHLKKKKKSMPDLGLRRSSRQRKIPKRLENSSNSDGSAASDDNQEEEMASSSSLFVSPVGTRSSRRSVDKQIRKARARARRITSTLSNNVDSSEDEHSVNNIHDDQPSTSAKCEEVIVKVEMNGETALEETEEPKIKLKNIKEAPSHIPFNITPGQPPPDVFLPPDWIKRVTPCNFPYVPQILDEVVYLRQGHESYISKVLAEHAWTVDDSQLCYKIFPDIGLAELCRVTCIEYHVGPPTLCEVFLIPLNRKISKKSAEFRVKYHDMPNVVDFLILKDKYDHSVKRQWSEGDRFRSIIDDSWWYGTVVEKRPHNPDFPESNFQSYSVVWDGDNDQSDIDYLSPWDMEAIPETISNSIVTRSHNHVNSASAVTGHVKIDSKEIRQTISYRFRQCDWRDRDESDSDDENIDFEKKMTRECNRIAEGIQKLIDSEEYFAFALPVDITQYPTYPLYAPYPTDLSTILQRVENRFYRRSAALCWEFSQLEKNALAFNEPESVIARKAKELHVLLDRFVKNKECTDIFDLQQQGEKSHESASSGEDDHAIMSEVDSRSRPIPTSEDESQDSRKSDLESQDTGISEYATTAGEDEEANAAWIEEAKSFLQDISNLRDSRPFREGRHQNEEDEGNEYLDLPTIKKRLEEGCYKTPEELKSDIEEMLTSFKNSDLSRESRSMYARFSPLVKSKINAIISNWSKVQSEKMTTRSLRRSRRNTRMASDSFSSPLSKSGSQDSDWLVEARTSNSTQNGRTPIGAYQTRQMLRRQRRSMVRYDESKPIEVRSSRSMRYSNRIQRRRGDMNVKRESFEVEDKEDSPSSSRLESIREDEDSVKNEHTKKFSGRRSKRRRLSDSDVEIGQGDAALNLNNAQSARKKARLSTMSHDSSCEDDVLENSDSDAEEETSLKNNRRSRSNGHVRKYARPPTFLKVEHNHRLRANRQKPVRYGDYSDLNESDSDDGGKCSKKVIKRRPQQRESLTATARNSVTCVSYTEDSDSDQYGPIVETDDLECEYPPHSPEGHPMPKKSKRFREINGSGENSFPQTSTWSPPRTEETLLKNNSPSKSFDENSDER